MSLFPPKKSIPFKLSVMILVSWTAQLGYTVGCQVEMTNGLKLYMVCGLCEYNAFNTGSGNWSTLDKHIDLIIHKGVWACKLR